MSLSERPLPQFGTAKWRAHVHRVVKQLYWYLAVGLAVAVLTPESFVADTKWVEAVVSGIARQVPGIERLAAVSPFPNATGVYWAAMWGLMPLAVAQFAVQWPPPTNPSTKHIANVIIFTPMFLALVGGLLFLFPFTPEPWQVSLSAGRGAVFLAILTQSRLGLGTLGSVSMFLIAMALGGWIKFVYVLVARQLRLTSGK